MVDEKFMELAQEHEEAERAAGIERMRRHVAARPIWIGGVTCCCACEEPLDAERAATGAGRCVDCQRDHERRESLFRGDRAGWNGAS
jgi:RNA polymerase-binding transcription factor DksA